MWIKHHWKQALLGVALIALVVGVLSGWMKIGHAVPLTATFVAALVAFSINETVQERRVREAEKSIRDKRSDVYYEVIEHVLSSFAPDGPPRTEVSIRPLIAVWGSDEFTKAYFGWRDSIEGLAGRGQITIPQDRQQKMRESLAALVSTAKTDLGTQTDDDPQIATLGALLFDDFEKTETT